MLRIGSATLRARTLVACTTCTLEVCCATILRIDASRLHAYFSPSLYPLLRIADEEPESSRLSRFPNTGARNHIEVTERADGSVVWQVIAGLADHRASTYSESNPTHSRHASDASQFSGTGLGFSRDSYASRDGGDGENGTSFSPRGQTVDLEDGRSLFAGRRGHGTSHKKQHSLDVVIPPLPNMPSRDGEAVQADESASTANPVWDYGPAASSPPVSRLPKSSATSSVSRKSEVKSPQHLGFEMATSPGSGDGPGPTSPTRIVYTSDAELAHMLESLSRGQDSAKFDVRFAGAAENRPERDGSFTMESAKEGERPLSNWTGRSSLRSLDPEEDQQRQRVEAESEFSSLEEFGFNWMRAPWWWKAEGGSDHSNCCLTYLPLTFSCFDFFLTSASLFSAATRERSN